MKTKLSLGKTTIKKLSVRTGVHAGYGGHVSDHVSVIGVPPATGPKVVKE